MLALSVTLRLPSALTHEPVLRLPGSHTAQRSQAVFGVEITRLTAPDAPLRRSAQRPIVRAYDGGPEAGALAGTAVDSSCDSLVAQRCAAIVSCAAR